MRCCWDRCTARRPGRTPRSKSTRVAAARRFERTGAQGSQSADQCLGRCRDGLCTTARTVERAREASSCSRRAACTRRALLAVPTGQEHRPTCSRPIPAPLEATTARQSDPRRPMLCGQRTCRGVLLVVQCPRRPYALSPMSDGRCRCPLAKAVQRACLQCTTLPQLA
jgi:hypothetical protein